MFKLIRQIFTAVFIYLKPGRNLFILMICLALLGVLTAFYPKLETVWPALSALLLVAVLWDALRLYAVNQLEIKRDAPGKMSLGLWHDVQLTVHYRAGWLGSQQLVVEVFDHYPVHCELRNLPVKLKIESGHWAKFDYQIKPLHRGNEVFGRVQCLVHSPWRLWFRNMAVGESFSTMVYPNFAAVSQYALLATENRLSLLGVKKIRRRGEGLDFNQLREYREGDALKQIDWKATARLHKLISREYQDEKDQEVIFLLDCGRRMRSQDDELSHFDHSLNAMLLLSWVALHQGDAVGFSTFGYRQDKGELEKERWFAARKGMVALPLLLNHLYDLQAGTASPDYTQAASQLLLKQKKRALVVVLTNLRDEDSADLLNALQLLKGKHLVVLASLKEQVLDKIMAQKVDDLPAALLYSATCDYQLERKKMFEHLSVHGINSLDVTPDKLAIHLVNRYLDIKRSGVL